MQMKIIRILVILYLLQLLVISLFRIIPIREKTIPSGYQIMIFKGCGGNWSCIPILGFLPILTGGYDVWVYDINFNSSYVVRQFDKIKDIAIDETKLTELTDGLVEINFGVESEYTAVFRK